MRIFAISDLHLSDSVDKPMNIFGSQWDDYWNKICEDWQCKVTDEDVVLISGDTSWAMYLDDAISDLTAISNLNGTKIIIRGNHDYWWQSFAKINALNLNKVVFLQNSAVKIGKYIFCGTRGWSVPEDNQKIDKNDLKIYQREVIRLNLTLTAADNMRNDDDSIVVMTHFPPFNSKFEDSEMTMLIKKFNAKCGVYGHLHGSHGRNKKIVNKHGINYYLTSCDLIDFSLMDLTDKID